jgi:FtsP/CotA-like multicopper oxidase with cupredoxin domain
MFATAARSGVGRHFVRRAVLRNLMIATAIAGGATVAWAQGAPEISNPTPLRARPPQGQTHTLLNLALKPAPSPAEAREVVFDLNVVYTKSHLWNPTDNRPDTVYLRSYQGEGVNPDAPFVAPLIEMYPGQTVRMTLNNKLPKDPNCPVSGGSANVPHCFNGTNMHSHGLWINPSGNGDNVTISINPGVSFQYEYNVPPDHPAGTFWYHSHRHGSTALQVSSGMAGPLIIRGTRPPTTSAHGDLDTLLKRSAAKPFPSA